ncbi:hypothetical protein [Jiangella anatolica]|uniref:Glycerophosphoryl diester phosphodiesterase membrane domain-containing protein n=1 Tax=Jiangella anatolica TaxID=2670374 RepID=A0A2W2B0E1_9ACTN|nr:hypothetical protein [Jiangella anatolica]PZF80905.1 hypothetical protein C1I92_23685 [Jiangella anatolica]
MSGIAGAPPPDDAARDDAAPDTGEDRGVPAPPPYPGWSPQQPGGPSGERAGGWEPPRPQQGWQQPSAGHPGGWDRPAGPTYSGPAGPGTPDGQPGQGGGWGGQQYGQPRYGQPGYGQQPGQQGQGYGAWSAGAGPAWRAPDVKPGVIPLRPLGVTEILDGAVTTIRRNLAAMLGLSAVVAAVTQILSAAALAWVFGDTITEPDLGLTNAEAIDTLARGIPAAVIGWLVTVVATVFLTGVLTVVVGQAVLGRDLSIGQAWRESKGRLPRLLGLTFVYTLIYFAPALVVLLLAVGLAAIGGTAAGVLMVLLVVAAIPVTIWLYVRYALSTPALMLETTSADGVSRPIRIFESLRRSAALVRTSWWRVFAILLLIVIITFLIGQVVAVPFGVPSMLGTDAGDDPVTWYVLNTLAGMISATITAPFAAAATALLYIDRRIRREGLDLELARAAGVDLHGRGGAGTPPGPS